jgi:FAD/FMN-containing dehydrogenase
MSKYLNKVLDVNTEERWALVEPGVVQEQLNLHLKPKGYLFGLIPRLPIAPRWVE